ncbi:hypothetical protein BGP_0581 [Beggiatoa sp. PS]|nr:hypothetical protein BGP_0581 [Beggiatoa sp. PS]
MEFKALALEFKALALEFKALALVFLENNYESRAPQILCKCIRMAQNGKTSDFSTHRQNGID